MGMQNGSGNIRGAWVALWDHPTHTDTDYTFYALKPQRLGRESYFFLQVTG
jgi:hypothetical protein